VNVNVIVDVDAHVIVGVLVNVDAHVIVDVNDPEERQRRVGCAKQSAWQMR
jgi:hypothetical protein